MLRFYSEATLPPSDSSSDRQYICRQKGCQSQHSQYTQLFLQIYANLHSLACCQQWSFAIETMASCTSASRTASMTDASSASNRVSKLEASLQTPNES